MLQNIELILSRLNECFACFNLWIFVPPRGPNRRTSWLHTLCLTLSYAVFEAIATRIIRISGLPPWAFAWCLNPLGASAAFAVMFLQDPESSENFVSNKDKYIFKHNPRYQVRSAVALLPCVLAAAVVNAAFLLFGQSLCASWIHQRYHITHVFGPITVVINLACHYSDYEIYKRTGRPLTLRELSCISVYGPAIISLAIFFSARLYVRKMIGVEPFLAFQALGAAQADALYPDPV